MSLSQTVGLQFNFNRRRRNHQMSLFVLWVFCACVVMMGFTYSPHSPVNHKYEDSQSVSQSVTVDESLSFSNSAHDSVSTTTIKHVDAEVGQTKAPAIEIKSSGMCIPFHNLMQQDDPLIIALIKQSDFLKPPPRPKVKRNLKRGKPWQSPVTSYVHQRLLKHKTYGFFVEARALDGEFLSHTLELEVYHGWTGLLVEGDKLRALQPLLTTERKAWIGTGCLSPYTTPVKMNMTTLMDGSGIENNSNPEFYKLGKAKALDQRVMSTPFEVQCYPLFSLLAAIGHTQIDYLSLNIEGAEHAVLRTIPFDRVSISAISVETNDDTEKITRFLQDNGYKRMHRIVVPYVEDTIYFKESE